MCVMSRHGEAMKVCTGDFRPDHFEGDIHREREPNDSDI